MVQFEWHLVIHPLVPFTFEVHCKHLCVHAGRGKCCMGPLEKVDIPTMDHKSEWHQVVYDHGWSIHTGPFAVLETYRFITV